MLGRCATVYQFLPLSMGAVAARMLPQVRAAGARVVLDLEDSVSDADDEVRSALMKGAARRSLLEMARDGRLVAGAPVGVRINAVDTAFHQDDLRAVAELAAHVAVDAVWLPKVERPDDLRAVLAALPAGLRVVVMAETRAGVAALPAVLAQGAGRLSGAVFGHVDYSLDTGLWPFPGADSAEVWDAAVRVMRAAEASDCPYIHTIVTELEDDEVFLRTQSMLAHLCRRPFARITLSLRQSRAAGRPFEPRPMALRSSPAQTLEERRAQALHVIEEFEQTRCRKRSFSLERSSRRLLSPHEYLLARRIVALHSPRP